MKITDVNLENVYNYLVARAAIGKATQRSKHMNTDTIITDAHIMVLKIGGKVGDNFLHLTVKMNGKTYCLDLCEKDILDRGIVVKDL